MSTLQMGGWERAGSTFGPKTCWQKLMFLVGEALYDGGKACGGSQVGRVLLEWHSGCAAAREKDMVACGRKELQCRSAGGRRKLEVLVHGHGGRRNNTMAKIRKVATATLKEKKELAICKNGKHSAPTKIPLLVVLGKGVVWVPQAGEKSSFSCNLHWHGVLHVFANRQLLHKSFHGPDPTVRPWRQWGCFRGEKTREPASGSWNDLRSSFIGSFFADLVGLTSWVCAVGGTQERKGHGRKGDNKAGFRYCAVRVSQTFGRRGDLKY